MNNLGLQKTTPSIQLIFELGIPFYKFIDYEAYLCQYDLINEKLLIKDDSWFLLGISRDKEKKFFSTIITNDFLEDSKMCKLCIQKMFDTINYTD